MFENILEEYYVKMGKQLSKSFTRYVCAAATASSFSTHEVARHLSKKTGKDFNTSEKSLAYLLSNSNFQIDDSHWRMHMKMIFDLLTEQGIIKRNKPVPIQIDFTSNRDYFLILCASIIVNNRAIPIYFTMRNYPKKGKQYNHKKMEGAFLRGLKHVLSKQYRYVIVADRGFGNSRIINQCEKIGFDYIIRITPNMRLETSDMLGICEDVLQKDGCYEAHIPTWQKNVRIIRHSKNDKKWYLVSNINFLSDNEIARTYADRFKIEKCFQDMKSSGFDMEKSKIRKYANYKRMLVICMTAHALMVMLGNFIATQLPRFFKNFALLAKPTLASLLSAEKLFSYSLVKPNT